VFVVKAAHACNAKRHNHTLVRPPPPTHTHTHKHTLTLRGSGSWLSSLTSFLVLRPLLVPQVRKTVTVFFKTVTRAFRSTRNKPPTSVSFIPAIASTSGRLHSEFIRLLFLQAHRETDRFFAASGVQLAESTSGLFHYQRAAFSAHLRTKVGGILPKDEALRVNLNIDGAPITSRTHTHPSHSQASRLLTCLCLEVFQFPDQLSVCEACRCLNHSF
jgi:hypothetical protein